MSKPQTPFAGSRMRRLALWAVLVGLLLVAQSLLVALTLNYESTRSQEQVEALAQAATGEVKRELTGVLQALQSLMWNEPAALRWREEAAALMREHRQVLRVERREPALEVGDELDSPWYGPLFQQMRRSTLDLETTQACMAARRSAAPHYSRSYFVPGPNGSGQEVMDVCVPLLQLGRDQGFVVATLGLSQVLDRSVGKEVARSHEISFVEADGSRLARAGLPRGSGVFRAERVVDLPGMHLQLRLDSAAGRPSLIPNLVTALVLGLSLALFAVVLLLARDVRRRALAESALAESLAFRKAMEDSLITGLRARDLQGRITYVNPAFCAMVGFAPEALLGQAEPPYWPPEHVREYSGRQHLRLAPRIGHEPRAREGFETLFMRRSGERFAVMIYEAPLVDGQGLHTGWMSAVLDVSEQRRIEELSRAQQERLAATARLATVGEMASLLSHELNQPLAAIASYAAGSLNMAEEPDALPLLKQGLQHIAEQAERAGRVIKSVHAFVRRREQLRESLGVDLLFEAVLPLIHLQARKGGAQVALNLPDKAPRITCDRTMVEQVLLNLARNAIQAMEALPSGQARELRLSAVQAHERWVTFELRDTGPGISPEVAQRLFTPFFTTRPEGMGLGLSLCRTVVEQHGGALQFESPVPGQAAGTVFRFTLAAARTNSATELPG